MGPAVESVGCCCDRTVGVAGVVAVVVVAVVAGAQERSPVAVGGAELNRGGGGCISTASSGLPP